MVSRARSGTGSGSPASQHSAQGKSFLTARGAGGWGGLLPSELPDRGGVLASMP